MSPPDGIPLQVLLVLPDIPGVIKQLVINHRLLVFEEIVDFGDALEVANSQSLILVLAQGSIVVHLDLKD